MKKHQKLWKALYKTYSNSALGRDSNVMTIKDVTRILKDHDLFKQLMSYDQIQQILRKTGTESAGGKLPDLS
jgi:hypothetical protein